MSRLAPVERKPLPWAVMLWATPPLDAQWEAQIGGIAGEHKGVPRVHARYVLMHKTIIFAFDFYRDAIKFQRYIKCLIKALRWKVGVGAPYPEDGTGGIDVRRVMYRRRSVRC